MNIYERNSIGIVLAAIVLSISGCDALRLAPSEAQKQNATLHHRTTATVATRAKQEKTSPLLQTLADRSVQQSEAMAAYFGRPKETPLARSVADLLSDENASLTDQARADALQRPDPWQLTDDLLEIALALAGLTGGVFGARLINFLRQARQRSRALREIIQGNQVFKQRHPNYSDAFKMAHNVQSNDTRKIVSELKA
jgi:hypothetical protein